MDKVKCTLCAGAGWVDCGVNAAYVLAGLSDDCSRCNGSGEEPKSKQDDKIENRS